MPVTPLISLRGISFQYRDQPILEQIDLDVMQGDFIGVIGPNGGGKTTLLNIILGVLHPNAGTVHVFGESLQRFHDWTKIGYVPQHVHQQEVHIPITVRETVELGRVAKAGLLRRLRKKDQDEVSTALRTVELFDLADRQLKELSGGQFQRVFIAKALAARAEVLILDEPTTGVDADSQEKFYALLRKLNASGLTLLLVSHDIDVVAREVNKVACINKKLVYHGNPDGLLQAEVIQKLYGSAHKMIAHHH